MATKTPDKPSPARAPSRRWNADGSPVYSVDFSAMKENTPSPSKLARAPPAADASPTPGQAAIAEKDKVIAEKERQLSAAKEDQQKQKAEASRLRGVAKEAASNLRGCLVETGRSPSLDAETENGEFGLLRSAVADAIAWMKDLAAQRLAITSDLDREAQMHATTRTALASINTEHESLRQRHREVVAAHDHHAATVAGLGRELELTRQELIRARELHESELQDFRARMKEKEDETRSIAARMKTNTRRLVLLFLGVAVVLLWAYSKRGVVLKALMPLLLPILGPYLPTLFQLKKRLLG